MNDYQQQEALSIVEDLAEWSKRWPRDRYYSSTIKMDKELVEIEKRAVRLQENILCTVKPEE